MSFDELKNIWDDANNHISAKNKTAEQIKDALKSTSKSKNILDIIKKRIIMDVLATYLSFFVLYFLFFKIEVPKVLTYIFIPSSLFILALTTLHIKSILGIQRVKRSSLSLKNELETLIKLIRYRCKIYKIVGSVFVLFLVPTFNIWFQIYEDPNCPFAFLTFNKYNLLKLFYNSLISFIIFFPIIIFLVNKFILSPLKGAEQKLNELVED